MGSPLREVYEKYKVIEAALSSCAMPGSCGYFSDPRRIACDLWPAFWIEGGFPAGIAPARVASPAIPVPIAPMRKSRLIIGLQLFLRRAEFLIQWNRIGPEFSLHVPRGAVAIASLP